MKTRVLVIAMLVIGALACASYAGAVTVSGRVVDENGSILPGVRVSAVEIVDCDRAKVTVDTVSDTDGQFSLEMQSKTPAQLENVPGVPGTVVITPDVYIVAYLADHYLGWTDLSTFADETSEDGKTIKRGSVRVSQVKDYTGRVHDKEQKPLEGVEVKVEHFRGRNDDWTSMVDGYIITATVPLPSAVTDEQGSFTLKNLPTHGTADLKVIKKGYARCDACETTNLTDVVMVKAGAIAGRIVDKQGNPVSDAWIVAMLDELGIDSRDEVNQDGTFSIDTLVPGTYRVYASRQEWASRSVGDVVVKVGKTTKVADLVLEPGVPVTGVLVEQETGKPIAGGVVSVADHPGVIIGASFALTGPDGKFSLKAVPGKAFIEALCDGYDGSSDPHDRRYFNIMDVGSQGVQDLVIKFIKLASVKGQVVDLQGKPVAGAQVSQAGAHSTVSTDTLGMFELALQENELGVSSLETGNEPGTTPNSLTVRAVSSASDTGIVQPVGMEELRQGKVILTLKPARKLKVTVQDSTSNPLAGAQVTQVSWGGNSGACFDPVAADNRGEVVLTLYEGETYELEVEKAGYYYIVDDEFSENRVTCGEEGWLDSTTLVMEPANRTQKGKVVDKDGNPVTGISVGAWKGPYAQTDAQGNFALEAMPDSEVWIGASNDDLYGDARVSKESGDVVIVVKKMSDSIGDGSSEFIIVE